MRRLLWQNCEEIAGAVLLVAMCLVGVVKVASRYLFSSPLAWTEELATLLFAWLVFIGASLALKKREHFAIEVFVALLPEVARRQIERLQLAAVALFCLLLIGFGLNLTAMSWTVQTPLLGISRGWIYLSVPVGGVLMLVRTIEAWYRGNPGRSRVAAPDASMDTATEGDG